MSAIKRFLEDVEALIDDGLEDDEIESRITEKYGASCTEDDWLAKQISYVRSHL